MAKQSYKAYTVSEALAMDRRTLREQYAKLSYVARQRIKKLSAKYPGYADVDNYDYRINEYAPLRLLRGKSDKEIAMRFSRLTKYLSQGTSTERGFKSSLEQTVERLNEHGYDFINTDNVIAFYRFMEDARQRGLNTIFGSEQLVQAFNRANKRKLTREQIIANMDYWKEHDNKKPRFYASRGRKADYD